MPRRNHPRPNRRPRAGLMPPTPEDERTSYQGMARDLVRRGLASPHILGPIPTWNGRRDDRRGDK